MLIVHFGRKKVIEKNLQSKPVGHSELSYNPLYPNINMHIFYTVIYTFPKVLTRRICLTIKSFFSW